MLDQKVTKKSSQQIGFFAHDAIALQAVRTTGWKSLTPLRARPRLCNRFRNALTTAQPTIFLPAFVRSFLLTGEEEEMKFVILSVAKNLTALIYTFKTTHVISNERWRGEIFYARYLRCRRFLVAPPFKASSSARSR